MQPPFMPALITPFTRSGLIDEDAVAHNVAVLHERGVQGFLLAGSNGEGPYLEPGERTALCSAAREAAPRAFLLCGVAAESVRLALRQAEEAAQGGADAALILSPTTLIRGRHRLVGRFFTDVADTAPLPVYLYSVPGVTAYDLPVDVALEAAAHTNVTGMKDSGGHPVKAAALVAGAPEGFSLYVGSSAALTQSVAAGAVGGITSSANYAPELVGRVVATARRSARNALPTQRRLTRLAAAVEAHGVAGVKAAAAEAGLHPGIPRPPLRPLTGAALRAVRDLVRAHLMDEAPDQAEH
jgi:dihydrodipicolinate synthase/N-acetylneuraminate lyase